MRLLASAVLAVTALWTSALADEARSLTPEEQVIQFIEDHAYLPVDWDVCEEILLEFLEVMPQMSYEEVWAGHDVLRAEHCLDKYSSIVYTPPLVVASTGVPSVATLEIAVEVEGYGVPASWESVPLRGGTAYIRIRDFNFPVESMVSGLFDLEMSRGLAEYHQVVLDLRSNLGGSLPLACELLAHFSIPANVFGYRIERYGAPKIWPDCQEGIVQFASSAQVVLLVNKRTASASERVAAVLGAIPNTITIGQTTYGKGAGTLRASFGPYEVNVVTEEFLIPGGGGLEDIGLTPLIPDELFDEVCGEDLPCILGRVDTDLSLLAALQRKVWTRNALERAAAFQ